MLANNMIYFLINQTFYMMCFHQIFTNINNITSINNIIINRKIVDMSIKSCFFFLMLLAVKPFEIFRKSKKYGFISEFFALN